MSGPAQQQAAVKKDFQLWDFTDSYTPHKVDRLDIHFEKIR